MNDVDTAINIKLSHPFTYNNCYQNINFNQYGDCTSHIERSPLIKQ